MIYHPPDSIEKVLDKMRQDLRKTEPCFCDKCRPLFHGFLNGGLRDSRISRSGKPVYIIRKQSSQRRG